MRGTFAALTAITTLLIAPACLSAKGETIRVTISGGNLAAPIQITDSTIVARFQVWAGPGTSSDEAQSLNVDWSHGVVEPPKDLTVYEVSFVTTRGAYVVRYGIDKSTGKGYVYLPGRGDSGYEANVGLIYRGLEGKWLGASTTWEKLARPLIAKAQTTHQ
jgi:hypothetical protein